MAAADVFSSSDGSDFDISEADDSDHSVSNDTVDDSMMITSMFDDDNDEGDFAGFIDTWIESGTLGQPINAGDGDGGRGRGHVRGSGRGRRVPVGRGRGRGRGHQLPVGHGRGGPGGDGSDSDSDTAILHAVRSAGNTPTGGWGTPVLRPVLHRGDLPANRHRDEHLRRSTTYCSSTPAARTLAACKCACAEVDGENAFINTI